jgi:hypothetical protein
MPYPLAKSSASAASTGAGSRNCARACNRRKETAADARSARTAPPQPTAMLARGSQASALRGALTLSSVLSSVLHVRLSRYGEDATGRSHWEPHELERKRSRKILKTRVRGRVRSLGHIDSIPGGGGPPRHGRAHPSRISCRPEVGPGIETGRSSLVSPASACTALPAAL